MWISLFKKQSDNEKAPVMNGVLKVTQELKDLVSNAQLDEDLDVAVWKKTSKSGNDYLSGQVSKKMEKKEYKGHPGKSQDDLPF